MVRILGLILVLNKLRLNVEHWNHLSHIRIDSNYSLYPDGLDDISDGDCEDPPNNGLNKLLATEYNKIINVIVNTCPPIVFNFAGLRSKS